MPLTRDTLFTHPHHPPSPGSWSAMSVPIAAIDVGSNSVRVAVMSRSAHGGLDVIEEARAVPRLIRDVEEHGQFQPETVEYLVGVLGDFRRIADAAGAEIVAVATSATRDARNGPALVDRIRTELGIDLRVISGDEEAQLAFLGATFTLPVTDGVVMDIGGGSMEVVRFEDRRAVQTWTLPLGAVRLTDRYLPSDPLATSELRKLRQEIGEQITSAGIPRLEDGATLVGTGGTIRNLGKIDRTRHTYPLSRLHGYEVSRAEMRRVVDLVQMRSVSERRSISGLNEDRADTIVAGGLVVEAMMNALGAPSLVVSGQGLREGMVLNCAPEPLPGLEALRWAATRATVARFVPGAVEVSERRLEILETLSLAVGLEVAPEFVNALAAAALVLDIGRCVDYYNRERHTEWLLLEHGLDGWSHRELALICALVRQAHQEKYAPATYRPLIEARDHEAIAIGGTLLALAEAIAARRPETDLIPLAWRREGDTLCISDAQLRQWNPNGLAGRFKRSFGLEVSFAG